MANLSGYILTDAGKHLLAAANAGSCTIQITKVKLGEDVINSVNDLLDKTDLIGTNLKLVDISGAVATKNVCTVQAVITNANQDTNFTIRQVGVFAKGVAAANPPDGVTAADVPETLYAVAYDTLPDIIPAQNGAVVITRQFDINLAIENSSSIKVVASPDGLVTVEILNKAIEEHNKDSNAHLGIFVAILGAVMKGILYLVDPADDSNDNQGATTGWVRRMFKTLLKAAFDASGVQYNFGQNGFIKLGEFFGGFCLQWRSYTANIQANELRVEPLPIAFSKPLAAFLSDTDGIGGVASDLTGGAKICSMSSTEIAWFYNWNYPQNMMINIFAIGRV